MTFSAVIITSGVLYTFIGINEFKDIYTDNRIELHNKISDIQEKHTSKIQDHLRIVSDDINEEIFILSNRVNDLDGSIIKIQTQIKEFHRN